MKILFYLHSLSSGGAERVTTTLANHWAGKGWEVVVVTDEAKDRDFYRLDSRIKRIALHMAIQSRNFWQSVVNNFRRITALYRILQCERPNVAVAMMATANVRLALAGRLACIPTIGSERIHPPFFPLGCFWERARRWVYPMLGGLVAQTQESAAWLQKYASAPRIVVIPNPVQYPLLPNLTQSTPSKVLSSLHGRRVLLAVGRLEEQKGFDRLLKAFAKLANRYPDWSLVILGQGRLYQPLIEQANLLGIGERVMLPGAVGNVGEWYERADLYALTSRFEGFPNTLLEALAYGLPAVAVDCETGPREIVRHGVDGLLVPQNDKDALVSALDRLMGDAALRDRFAERAVEARQRFAVERIAQKWEELFANV